ncbi:hypothetical protein MBLNU457_g0303t1 [Dothideomycetes sp. NU457]
MSLNHIYAVAVTDPQDVGSAAKWAISVQPKKTKRLFHHDNPHTVNFEAHVGTLSRRKTHEPNNERLLVKMIIGENEVSKIAESVGKVLNSAPEASSQELWLKDAVTRLQREQLVGQFDVDAFVEVAEETLRSQQAHPDAVAIEVDYLAELKRTSSVEEMHQTREKALKEKKSFGGFWISRPEPPPQRVRRVNPWERQDDAYGGLM